MYDNTDIGTLIWYLDDCFIDMVSGCGVVYQAMNEKAKTLTGVEQWPYRAIARSLEVIPRTLIQNCGANTIRTLTALRVSISVLQILSYVIYSCILSDVASSK